MINGFGAGSALRIWQGHDAEFIDALIFAVNQLRKDPEERLSEYLLKCADRHYEEQGGEAQRLKDLGYRPGQTVIQDADPAILGKMLAQIKEREANGEIK
ncbi:MAG: hypothetical protein AAF329_01055 [Cyanobacteria bacterium P01_A01_bin.17]